MPSGTPESKGRRVPSKEKIDAVLRLLKGEEISVLARELGVASERLARWRQEFVDAGEAALTKKKSHSHSSLWKNRKLLMQWGGVIAVLVLVVFFLTRFFETGGAAAAP